MCKKLNRDDMAKLLVLWFERDGVYVSESEVIRFGDAGFVDICSYVTKIEHHWKEVVMRQYVGVCIARHSCKILDCASRSVDKKATSDLSQFLHQQTGLYWSTPEHL